jgi:hypothetical protein
MTVHRNGAAKRPKRRYRRRTDPPVVQKVDKLLLALALEAAGMDASRLVIIDEHTIYVRNPVNRYY